MVYGWWGDGMERKADSGLNEIRLTNRDSLGRRIAKFAATAAIGGSVFFSPGHTIADESGSLAATQIQTREMGTIEFSNYLRSLTFERDVGNFLRRIGVNTPQADARLVARAIYMDFSRAGSRTDQETLRRLNGEISVGFKKFLQGLSNYAFSDDLTVFLSDAVRTRNVNIGDREIRRISETIEAAARGFARADITTAKWREDPK